MQDAAVHANAATVDSTTRDPNTRSRDITVVSSSEHHSRRLISPWDPEWDDNSDTDSFSEEDGDLPIGYAFVDENGFTRYMLGPRIPDYWPEVDKDCHFFACCAGCCFDRGLTSEDENRFEDLIEEGITEARTIPLSPAILPQYVDDLVVLIGTEGSDAGRHLNRLANVLFRRLQRSVAVCATRSECCCAAVSAWPMFNIGGATYNEDFFWICNTGKGI